MSDFDPLAQHAHDLQAFWADHQAPDRLDADQCPADAVTDLSGLERGGSTIRDTRQEPDKLVMRADMLRAVERQA